MIKKYFSNQEIAEKLELMAAIYSLKEENRFKIKAYQEAADSIKNKTTSIRELWEKGELKKIAGIGENIASYLNELFEKGKVKHFQETFDFVPKSFFKFIKISGIGPKTAYKLAEKLKIKSSKNALKRLKKAGEKGKIRELEGFGLKSEKEILKNIKNYSGKTKRILLHHALAMAQKIKTYLEKCQQVKRVDLLGSLRRKCATIGDIDIAVATDKPKDVIQHFCNYPQKIKVIEAGEKKAALLAFDKKRIDLRVQKLDSYGSLLQHFTGSKEHNIRLRELALKKGLSVSEYGISKFKSEKEKFKSEKDFYNFLELDWIPPELREDRGEIEAAGKNNLPNLINQKDIKGDLQIHSSFDVEPSHDLGQNSMKEIRKKAEKLGYQYIAFTEHNPSISKHNNKQIIDIIKRKKEEVDKINYSNNKDTQGKVFVFNSLEIDISPKGDLYLPEKAFKYLDFALVSVHSSFNLNKKKMTQRILKAFEHPKAKILAHPTGRIIGKRKPISLDWDKIFDFCKKNKKFLEINAFYKRLDLSDTLVKRAVDNGVKLTLGTDAHAQKQMEFMKYGVAMARKGWAEKRDVINCLSCDKIKKVLIS